MNAFENVRTTKWLVASGIGERLRMDMPGEPSHLVAGKLEVAARLSSHATISVGTRFERNAVTGRLTKAVSVQASFKTVK
jgi:hypothetical protein